MRENGVRGSGVRGRGSGVRGRDVRCPPPLWGRPYLFSSTWRHLFIWSHYTRDDVVEWEWKYRNGNTVWSTWHDEAA